MPTRLVAEGDYCGVLVWESWITLQIWVLWLLTILVVGLLTEFDHSAGTLLILYHSVATTVRTLYMHMEARPCTYVQL